MLIFRAWATCVNTRVKVKPVRPERSALGKTETAASSKITRATWEFLTDARQPEVDYFAVMG